MAVYRLILYPGLAASNKVIAETENESRRRIEISGNGDVMLWYAFPDNDFCRDIDGKKVIVS